MAQRASWCSLPLRTAPPRLAIMRRLPRPWIVPSPRLLHHIALLLSSLRLIQYIYDCNLIYQCTSVPLSSFRRASMTESMSSTSSDLFEALRKRSNISHKFSFHYLPTLELTPTTQGRPPIGSEIDWSRHASLTNEQYFLYRSQASLVARISELRAHAFLSFPTPSSLLRGFRQVFVSDAKLSDEMLNGIADLKADRDELRRYIDVWCTRVLADVKKWSSAFCAPCRHSGRARS